MNRAATSQVFYPDAKLVNTSINIYSDNVASFVGAHSKLFKRKFGKEFILVLIIAAFEVVVNLQ